jgi:hypothetical protein
MIKGRAAVGRALLHRRQNIGKQQERNEERVRGLYDTRENSFEKIHVRRQNSRK